MLHWYCKRTHHKYRVDTTTFYPDGSRRKGVYYTMSVGQITDALESNPRCCGFEHPYPNQYDEYTEYSHTVHHVTKIY